MGLDLMATLSTGGAAVPAESFKLICVSQFFSHVHKNTAVDLFRTRVQVELGSIYYHCKFTSTEILGAYAGSYTHTHPEKVGGCTDAHAGHRLSLPTWKPGVSGTLTGEGAQGGDTWGLRGRSMSHMWCPWPVHFVITELTSTGQRVHNLKQKRRLDLKKKKKACLPV